MVEEKIEKIEKIYKLSYNSCVIHLLQAEKKQRSRGKKPRRALGALALGSHNSVLRKLLLFHMLFSGSEYNIVQHYTTLQPYIVLLIAQIGICKAGKRCHYI